MTNPSTVYTISDEALRIIISLRLSIFFLVPFCVILQAWTEQLKPRGISLSDCTLEITKRALWYIVPIEVIAAIAYVFYRDQFEACVNIASGYSEAPLLGIVASLLVCGVLWFASWYYPAQGIVNKMATIRVSEHISGAVVENGSKKQQADKAFHVKFVRSKEAQAGHYISTVSVAGLYMPPESEMRHFLFLGSTGAGKTAAVRGLLRSVQERSQYTKERVLMLDPDGAYLSRFYNPKRGDKILNPFDARAMKWALFKEISEPWDIENIANALVPDPGGESGQWADKARLVVSSALQYLSKIPDAESRDLYEVCCLSTVPELREILSKTSAARFFEEGNEKTLLSILTTVTKALAPFQYVERGDNFSMSEWIREGKGWLFLPYNDGQIAALQAIYRTWMRVAISATMSLPEADHRLWLVIDEFDALGKIPGLKDALTRIRRFGGRVLLGTQTSALIEELYGKGFGKAITENCLNQFILRCSNSENGGTAKFASDLIGEHHIRRTLNSSSTSSGSGSSSSGSSSNQGTSFSQTEQEATEAAVSPTDISRLQDLTGYLKFATEPDWQMISYEHDGLPIIAAPFEPKG